MPVRKSKAKTNSNFAAGKFCVSVFGARHLFFNETTVASHSCTAVHASAAPGTVLPLSIAPLHYTHACMPGRFSCHKSQMYK